MKNREGKKEEERGNQKSGQAVMHEAGIARHASLPSRSDTRARDDSPIEPLYIDLALLAPGPLLSCFRTPIISHRRFTSNSSGDR